MDIDLNCDLGEGCAFDADLIPLVTSVSIACGFHAGSPAEASMALRHALRQGVRAGAHPSFPDRANFGRLEMARTEEQIFEDCVYQIGALAALAEAVGGRLSHVKAHGALYNIACRDDGYARPVVAAATQFGLPLFGLPGSRLQVLSAGRCPFVAEGFADRRYQPDGSLVPRSQSDAFLESPEEAARQADWLVRERGVRTICVHGDNPAALQFVKELRTTLTALGHRIRAFES
jgi:UPF0271 protein